MRYSYDGLIEHVNGFCACVQNVCMRSFYGRLYRVPMWVPMLSHYDFNEKFQEKLQKSQSKKEKLQNPNEKTQKKTRLRVNQP